VATHDLSLFVLLSFTRPIRSGHRSGLHRGETSLLLRGSFPPATMPSADFSHAVRAGYPTLSRVRHMGDRARGNTCLSVRKCRVYGHALRWIEDFILLCRLVPACAPYTRFLCVIPYFRGTLPRPDGLLPKYRHRHPVAIPLHPSPPSGWV